MVEFETEPGIASAASGGTPASPARTHVPEQYERLLALLEQAERELASGAASGRSPYLEEASGVIFDLLYALDFRQGGELAARLAALYGYIGNQLLDVGRTGDRLRLAHLRDMIQTLRQAWHDEAAEAS